ncbi:unnamed protein product [Caenorhabditis nigoni]
MVVSQIEETPEGLQKRLDRFAPNLTVSALLGRSKTFIKQGPQLWLAVRKPENRHIENMIADPGAMPKEKEGKTEEEEQMAGKGGNSFKMVVRAVNFDPIKMDARRIKDRLATNNNNLRTVRNQLLR